MGSEMCIRDSLYHTWISASDRQFLQTNVWQVCPLSTECRRSIGICSGTSSRPSPGSYKPPLASSVQESYVQDLWCWCGSVLTALLPVTSPNSAFLLLLLQVVSISVSLDELPQVPTALTTIGRRSYAVAEPSLWNRLPAALQRPLHTFKRQLKAYLFHI